MIAVDTCLLFLV